MPNCFFCYKNAGDEQYHAKCAKRFFGTNEIPVLELNESILEELAKKSVNDRITVTGVQPKISVTLQKSGDRPRLTIVGLWGEFILKPNHHLFPWMPETEDLTMHIASLFKINTCEHALIKATDGNLVYVAKRFDRSNSRKIHIEDLCQLSEFLTENKYKGSYEKAGKLVAKYCNLGLDVLNYFELVLFCYLSGNNDMHLKNFSLVHGDKEIRFSPAYDLLNVNLVNPADQEELALTLNAKKRKIKLADFVVLAEILQIPVKSYQNSFRRFSEKNEAVFSLIENSFLPAEAKDQYKEIWMKKQQIFIR
ncbi:MAG: HipA domain-containing protein [Bacteroidota bacterium]